ncbi:Endonuclease/exonuclease/phosphatase [Lentinula edodes]|nr:Endonuclease/exonuclease/phosphatase [Lentinula edodes]
MCCPSVTLKVAVAVHAPPPYGQIAPDVLGNILREKFFLGSPSSTGEPLGDEALNSKLISEDQRSDNDQANITVSDVQPAPTLPTQHSLRLATTREHQLKSFISLRTKSSSQPAIIRLNDANGAIHFQNAGHSPLSPLLNPSSSRAFSSQSRDGFAATGGLAVSKPIAKGMSSSKLPLKPLEQPAGRDGRFTSAQKGKKKTPTTIQRESSFPDLLYPPDFKLDKHPPKEKAGDQNIHVERNFIHLHQLLTLDQSTLAQLLTTLNKLQSDFTAFTMTPTTSHNLRSHLPPLLLPFLLYLLPLSLPLHLCPRTQSTSSCPKSERAPIYFLASQTAPPSPSKFARIASPHHLGHSPSAILLAPARWALPTSSAAIIAMLGRWQTFFNAHGASLPLPDLAECLDTTEDGSYVVRLSFTDKSLNTFMRTWKTHQPKIPKIFDVSKRVSLGSSAQPSSYSSSPPTASHSLNGVPLHTSIYDSCTTPTTSSSLKIMSWNINGRYLLNYLSSEFLNLLQTADIILLQEIRPQSESCMKTPLGFISFNPWGGVATLVRDNLDCLLRQDLSSPDLLVVEVNGTLIRNIYIPPESSHTNWLDWSDINPWDAFVENTHLLMQIDMPTITGSNINARIGDLLPHAEHPDRVSSNFTVSTRGRLLLDLCNDAQLTILNGSSSLPGSHSSPTSFQRRRDSWEHLITLKTVIDYFIITSFLLPFVSKLNVSPETEWSDHSPITLNIIAPRRSPTTTSPRCAPRRPIIHLPLRTDTDFFQDCILHTRLS